MIKSLIACDSSGLCQPIFPQSLHPHFLETAFEQPFPKPSAALTQGIISRKAHL